jgi:hypothetical protein
VDLLKLVALEQDDLAVLSAHAQDAVVRVADVFWRPAEKRLVIALNRFDWEAAEDSRYQRRRSALRFDRVGAFKCRGIDPADKDAVLNLLAIEFLENDPPAGVIMLTFSGGAALRLDVECLEAELADLGPAWATAACPAHQGKTGLA